MSSLIVAADLDLVMLEISIEELVVPRVSDFDSAVMKKTIVMFRMLDKDWTSVCPQRNDYQIYRGSNYDREPFNGGVSVVFAMPQSSFESDMEKVDLQLHVRKELSKYFELHACETVGIACIDVTDLFNGVIGRLRERKGRFADREPVAKSSKNTYQLVKEDGSESGANTTVYLRLTHLGQTVISEIEVPDDPKLLFYAREETSDKLPYQFREINQDELTSGCWGSGTLIPPRRPRDTICRCDPEARKKPADISISDDFADSNNSAKDTTKREGAEQLGGGGAKGAKGAKRKPKSDNGEGEGDKDAGIKRKVVNGGEGGNGKKKAEKKKEGKKKREKEEKMTEETGGETLVEEVEKVGEKVQDDDDQGAVSCLVKPLLCGREGTCNKKDKKGKFGRCGRPDGEGGNPMACGEQRKCARRKMAAGSATVGIVDKKIHPACPPHVRTPNCCPCPTGQSPWSTSRYDATTPCARCKIGFNHEPIPEVNFCRHYEAGGFRGFEQPAAAVGFQKMHFG